MAYAFAVPIPPGKTAEVRALMAEVLGPRKAYYEDMGRRAEATEEYYWLQSDPSGDLLVVSSNSDQQKFLALLSNPENDFDRWLAERVRAVFGGDAEPGMGAVNEPLGELHVGN
jgi:hypothetical protein